MIDMTFHHVGIGVLDMQDAIRLYEALGHRLVRNIEDPGINIRVAFLASPSGGPWIELLAPLNPSGPLDSLIKRKLLPSPYHTCYGVNDIDQAGDVDAYLVSLNMQMALQPFDDTGRARIAQLINKSNQFNLTTRRYTEAEVAAAQHDAEAFTLQVRLADAFGDNGMISVIICRRERDDWDIDTWLMSCRVLGRKVEVAVLQELLVQARARGIQRLVGRYLPTEKNKLVEDHYAKLGFTLLERGADGSSAWVLPVADVPRVALPIAVQRVGYGSPEPAAA